MADRAPGAPADLDTIAKADWRKMKAHIEKRGDWTDEYRHVLSNTVRFMQLARNAWDGWHVTKGEGASKVELPVLTVEGSKGQGVTNPAIRVWTDAQRDALKGLQALALTPQEAARAGLTMPKGDGNSKFGFGDD